MSPGYWDVHQVARHYGISRATTFRHLKSGKIPRPVKIGRLTRWRVADVIEHRFDPQAA